MAEVVGGIEVHVPKRDGTHRIYKNLNKSQANKLLQAWKKREMKAIRKPVSRI